MKCKGIWKDKPCPLGAEAIEGREYCAECWSAGEDLAREDQHFAPDDPDDSAGGFEYPHLSDDEDHRIYDDIGF